MSNAYQFNQFTVAVSAELEFTLQYRLSFFPIVYIFLTFGGGIELTTGLTVDREVHEMERQGDAGPIRRIGARTPTRRRWKRIRA